jgi:predicted TIM-barrel fold metal-dependent hydrolase
MLIDAHTHCYPAEAGRDPGGWAASLGETHWAGLVAPAGRPSIQGWASPEQMLSAMDAVGVDKAVLLGWYWERTATCRCNNRWMAEWIALAPERFIGFASVQPADEPAAVRDLLEEAAALGLRGAGELHFGVQGFSVDSPGWETLAGWCCEHAWPVNFHATEAAGHDHPGSVPTPLNTFLRIAGAHPDLRMVLAHWGGGLPFFRHNPRLRPLLENVFYDTAASPLLYHHDIFRSVVDLVGADRVLYGSDYPLRLYPAQSKTAEMGLFLDSIRMDAGLEPAEARAVLGGNAARLLGLER